MDKSVLQQYKFREQSEGIMVGGYSINDIVGTYDKQLEPFSVPVGLCLSTSQSMSGGAEQQKQKTIIGGTIEEAHFDKLYGAIAKHISKSKSATTKKALLLHKK